MWENGKNCENHGCTVIRGCITMCIEIISEYGGGSFFCFCFLIRFVTDLF